MLKRLRKYFALEWRLQVLFVQAFLRLGLIRYSLERKPFKELTADLKLHRNLVALPPLADDSRQIARDVGWAVRTASRFTPWTSTCLVQVLAARHILQKRGIAGAFFLGAMQAGVANEIAAISAHAWLICDDEFITGESGHDRYTVVTSFSWS